MNRLLFEKTGNAVWISHLDLMRLFQRAFKRAGLPLTHTQGYNPRPSVSIALPLSVGVESKCELLDFELDGCNAACEDICKRLNEALVTGIRVLSCSENGRKLKELSLLRCTVNMEYDEGVPDGAEAAVTELFSRKSLPVMRKTKNGPQEQDIIPMIKNLLVRKADGNHIVLDAVVCCQNPSLNPMQLSAAVSAHLPDMKPDHCCYRREEIYDGEQNVFR